MSLDKKITFHGRDIMKRIDAKARTAIREKYTQTPPEANSIADAVKMRQAFKAVYDCWVNNPVQSMLGDRDVKALIDAYVLLVESWGEFYLDRSCGYRPDTPHYRICSKQLPCPEHNTALEPPAYRVSVGRLNDVAALEEKLHEPAQPFLVAYRRLVAVLFLPNSYSTLDLLAMLTADEDRHAAEEAEIEQRRQRDAFRENVMKWVD